jgi:TolB-like protein/tetratricopeptide (TPR) repeat protein
LSAISWRAIKELLSTAEGLEPEARRSFLTEQVPDPARRQAIYALLADKTTATRVPGSPLDGLTPGVDVELRPGTSIGPYRVVERIGVGGMGEVYLGIDDRLQRKVALKCLLSKSADAEVRTKVLHEARMAARLSHPNVATVHDIVEQDGRAFIVMEYVEGESLAARIARGAFDAGAVVAVGRQLASALAAAHARGVVHRDLKPANVQVRPDGSVKILDFGVARAMELLSTAEAAAADHLVSAGERGPGTPAYMSPEQLIGMPADERSDIYSLGVVLYEMATGRRPFQGTGAMAVFAFVDETPRRVDELNPAIPAPLARIIERASNPEREARFASADDLERALASALPEARPDRRRLFVAAGAVIVAIAIIALVEFPAVLGTRTEPVPAAGPPVRIVRSIAVLPLQSLSPDATLAYFADVLTDGVINMLGRVSALKVIARLSVIPFKGSSQSITEIARALGVDAVVEGTAFASADAAGRQLVRVNVNLIDPATQTQFWTGSVEREATDVLALQNELATRIAEGIRVAVTPDERARLQRGGTVKSEALRLYLLGRDEWNGRTLPHVNAALEDFTRAIEADPGYAPSYAGAADSYTLLGADYGAMPRDAALKAALASAGKAIELDPSLGEAYASMGFANRVLNWDWRLAEEQLRKAIDLNPSYATAHQWYGNLLSDLGREDESLGQMNRALELDPLSAIISRDVAWPLFFARRYDEAIRHLNGTLAAHPGYASAERLLARALAQKGSHEEAIRYFEALARRDRGPRAACELAWAYALAGRPRDAERELARARASEAHVYPYDLALVLTALRRPGEALTALERAYDERDATMLNLRHDPRLDSLRPDPRYRALLAKMRFPD